MHAKMLIVVGTRIRDARMSRNLSLNAVADRAHISVATLSRIERDKQGLDLGLFLILCKILHFTPQQMLGGEAAEAGDPLADQIVTMQHEERLKLWRDLATNRRSNHRQRTTRTEARKVNEEIEELLAQFEFVRAEIESVQSRMRRR